MVAILLWTLTTVPLAMDRLGKYKKMDKIILKEFHSSCIIKKMKACLLLFLDISRK